jgi:hypothetical protein
MPSARMPARRGVNSMDDKLDDDDLDDDPEEAAEIA